MARRSPDRRRIDSVFAQVMDLPLRRPSPQQPKRLDALFDELGQRRPSREPDDLEDLIWAIWIDHANARASASMAAATQAMMAGERDLARPILDRLIEDHPDWAEAWNKRATVAFLDKRDDQSVEDLAETLRLEPRHFGAVSGFAQICLRRGYLEEARASFQMALRINPHLQGVGDIIEALGRSMDRPH